MADHQQRDPGVQAGQAINPTATSNLDGERASNGSEAPATVSAEDTANRRSDDLNNTDNAASDPATVIAATAPAPRGRSDEIKAEDAQFAKRTISPSPTRSSLSAALHAHAPSLASSSSRPGSRSASRAGSRNASRAGSPAAVTRAVAPIESPGSGALTPADLTTEEQLERLKHKVQDLSSQVTSLNGKLVASYNRVGNLEDEADQKVMEIKTLASKVERLEAERKTWEDKYEGGLLVEKDHVQLELTRMMDRVIEETASRGKAESDKAHIEQELEQLSSQLFTEANKMVAIERMERLKAERKMEELERSFNDTQELMMGQSAQMRDLGSKIDDLEDEREHLKKQVEELQHQLVSVSSSSSASASSAPSQDGSDDESDANGSNISIRSESIGGFTPVLPSTSLPDPQSFLSSSVTSQPGFYLQMPMPGNAMAPGTPGAAARGILITHPIQFLSFELPPFQEFVLWTKSLMRTRRTIMSRPILDPNTTTGAYGGAYAAYGAPYAAASMSQGPSMPGYMSEAERQQALKESIQLSQYLNSPFIKRILEEDSDPTLKLDNAPGISFFSRRQIANAIVDGDLAIEPAFTSLPSDKCSLCGTSLAKFIASHQVTQPKDDPRKKLTRLATNWIPSSISGTATPTKEAQEKSSKDPWSISALTDALGSLTPSRELGGFSFGVGGSSEKEKANQGHYTAYNPQSAGSRPGSAGGRSLPTDRKSSLPPLHRQASMSGKPDAENGSKDGVQHDYVLTQSARQQGQIYLFRSLESSTRYTLCPHYCLPRLRAVCELWTYVRNIHKGLLLEDNPKIYPSPFGTSNEYTKLFRKLTASVQSTQTQFANHVIQDVRTPAPGLSRQLGDGAAPPPAAPPSSLSISEKADDNKTEADDSKPPIITTTNTIRGFDASSTPVGLGLDMETRKTAETSDVDASSASSNAGDDDNSAKPSEASTAATSSDSLPSGSGEGQSKEASNENKSSSPAIPVPARPPRSAARSSPMTPSTSGDGGKFPMPSALSITQLKKEETVEGDKTPTQSPEMKQGEAPSSQPTSAVTKPETFAMPNSPRTPSGLGVIPPALPPRSPRFAGPGRPAPGRITLPSSGLSLSTSLKSEGGISSMTSATTPGPASAGTAASGAAGPVSSSQADWQQKCWYEVIRLKEGVFWSRVGANYNKEH
ncbi:hypothetical protein P389DRAFT_198206 [Cystobasidium minutum MCA 4210]|uniref:uncharacterized protein n=1 Tax=Cystobasidium minutum MCA 4210 TaxID=1397322 RepID=UPI0034CEB915|eukprot:jgi/Rhomi1/198206/gm1.6420_g